MSDPTLLRIRTEVDDMRRAGAAFGVAEWGSRGGGPATAMVVIAATPEAAAALWRVLPMALAGAGEEGSDGG